MTVESVIILIGNYKIKLAWTEHYIKWNEQLEVINSYPGDTEECIS